MRSALVARTVDYKIDFTDCQRLEKLIDTLSLSQEILGSFEEIACMLQNSSCAPQNFGQDQANCYFRESSRIRRYINRIQSFIKAASALERQAERVSLLVGEGQLRYKLDS
jgi:hypothetical protein